MSLNDLLNGHFALESGPSSTSNGLAFWLSEKTVRKFADISIRILSSATKMLPSDCAGNKCYGVIHWGNPKRKRQTSGLYSHSQFSHMLITDVCSVENK